MLQVRAQAVRHVAQSRKAWNYFSYLSILILNIYHYLHNCYLYDCQIEWLCEGEGDSRGPDGALGSLLLPGERQTTGDEGGKGQKKQRDNKEAATRRTSLTQPISRPCSLRVDINFMGATFPEQGVVLKQWESPPLPPSSKKRMINAGEYISGLPKHYWKSRCNVLKLSEPTNFRDSRTD